MIEPEVLSRFKRRTSQILSLVGEWLYETAPIG